MNERVIQYVLVVSFARTCAVMPGRVRCERFVWRLCEWHLWRMSNRDLRNSQTGIKTNFLVRTQYLAICSHKTYPFIQHSFFSSDKIGANLLITKMRNLEQSLKEAGSFHSLHFESCQRYVSKLSDRYQQTTRNQRPIGVQLWELKGVNRDSKKHTLMDIKSAQDVKSLGSRIKIKAAGLKSKILKFLRRDTGKVALGVLDEDEDEYDDDHKSDLNYDIKIHALDA